MAQPQMASQYADSFSEAQNPALQNRVTMAMVRFAYTVSSEPDDTPNHVARQRLAEQIARNPQMFSLPMTLLVVSQGFNNQGEDGVLGDWIRAVWDTLAGRATV